MRKDKLKARGPSADIDLGYVLTKKFDLALLSNVIQIIPVRRHRDLVLEYCSQKLRAEGYLLWISQFGDTNYADRLVHKARDGYLVGLGRSRATFYREFSASEIDAIVTKHGFNLVKSFPFWKNHARLYRTA